MSTTKPFLKWPGGKYRLVEDIGEALGTGTRLVEPFLGSGAVFLNTDYEKYLLADNNQDLINLYICLRDNGEDFIEYSRSFFEKFNNKDSYYEFRKVFNSTNDVLLKSALFIYLNRHCYNGLCRYNSSGGFNTPFGQYKKPLFPEQAMRSFITRSQKAEMITSDFRKTLGRAEKGDVVYCDPPYTPLSTTSRFTDYYTGGFGWKEQQELAEQALLLAGKGITTVISNHDTPEIRTLYKKARIIPLKVRRSISRDKFNRNMVDEVIAIFN
ncbi:MAG: DNA adenine methylase [Gammaproteobacteria bacterium RBG_16_51_14]|nr:MAG: DNA adenine methylase [Gammaproteobacteria bacterium RBG_16_51_14]